VSRQPLLLLHAGGTDPRMWEPLRGELGDGYDVLAPAMGHAPAAEALALLDAHGSGRALVVGASRGGNVALQLATRAPGRVSGLALFAATLFDRGFSAELEAFRAQEEALFAAGADVLRVYDGATAWPSPRGVDSSVRGRENS